MIILIRKSELFTIDPDIRFSNINHVELGLWKEMWRRFKILGYTTKELQEYYELKTKKQISSKSVKRWILRTDIYSRTKPIIDMGCESLNSNFFDELEWFVVKELIKNLKFSVQQNVKTLP
jgi:hypothetical protein